MNRPKVLFFLQLPPPIHGQSTVNNFIKNSSLINTNFDTKYIDISPAIALSDIGKLSFGKIFQTFKILFSSIYSILTFKSQIVYITLTHKDIAFYKDALIVMFVKFLSKSKIVIHLHGRGIDEIVTTDNFRRKLYTFVFNGTYVIVLSETLKLDIKEIYKSNPYVLSNGLPNSNYMRGNTLDNLPRILFLSNLIIDKGILTFIEIIKAIQGQGIKFRASIIGQEADLTYEDLEKIISESHLQNYVKSLGQVFGEEKNEILRNTDILIFPSVNEAFPLVLLEAMQYGVCIIANSVGGIPDMIINGKTGFLVNNNQVDEYVSIVSNLLWDKSLIERVSYEAQNQFKEKYTLEIFEHNFINILSNVLKNT